MLQLRKAEIKLLILYLCERKWLLTDTLSRSTAWPLQTLVYFLSSAVWAVFVFLGLVWFLAENEELLFSNFHANSLCERSKTVMMGSLSGTKTNTPVSLAQSDDEDDNNTITHGILGIRLWSRSLLSFRLRIFWTILEAWLRY